MFLLSSSDCFLRVWMGSWRFRSSMSLITAVLTNNMVCSVYYRRHVTFRVWKSLYNSVALCDGGGSVTCVCVGGGAGGGRGGTMEPQRKRGRCVCFWGTDKQTRDRQRERGEKWRAREVIAGKREDNNANWHFRNEIPVALATGPGLGATGKGVRVSEGGRERLQRGLR